MRVTPPDIELWFTGHLRSQSARTILDVDISNKEPESLSIPLVRPLIVVRDDSGPRLDLTTFDRSLGFSILAGSRMNDQPASDLARWVASVVHDSGLPMQPGSPIARVLWSGCTGPYPVTERLDVARRYLTGQYIVTGSW